MKAILLGAGYATRMGDLTKGGPKALLELEEGKPILNYIVEELEKIPAIDEACIITNDKFFTHFTNWTEKFKFRFPIKVLNDGTNSNENRLGAIGDVVFTLEKLKYNDDVVILATDNHFSFELKDAYNYFIKKKTDCIIAKEFEDKSFVAGKYAVAELDRKGLVLDIVEKPLEPKTGIGVYAVYFIKKEDVPLYFTYRDLGLKMDSPGNFITYLYKVRPVHCYVFDGIAIDVGTPELYYEAVALFRNPKK